MVDPIYDRLSTGMSASDGGKTVTSIYPGWYSAECTTAPDAGTDFYFEVVVPTVGNANNMIGVCSADNSPAGWYIGVNATSWGYFGVNGTKIHNTSQVSYGATWAATARIGVLLMSGALYFWLDGSGWQGATDEDSPVGKVAAYTGITDKVWPGVSSHDQGTQFDGKFVAADITNTTVPVGVLLGVQSTAAYVRSLSEQVYGLLGTNLRVTVELFYSMLINCRALFEQPYGLRMLAALQQLYGDMPAFRRLLDQRYSDSPLLRRLIEQAYGEAYQYRAVLDQSYNFPAAIRRILTQKYSIADHQVRTFVEQQYELLDRDLLRRLLEQQYVLAAGAALVQSSDIKVTCDGLVHTSMYNINLEQDEALYHMTGELALADEGEYLAYKPFVSEVTVTVDGTSYNFIAGRKRAPRLESANSYIVPLVSRTVLLGAPHAVTEPGELTGMVSELIEELAAGFTVDYRLVDWFLPPGRLQTNSEPPIELIRKLVVAAGGVMQTSPDGVLICRPEYPVSVNRWETSAPDIELTDQDDFFQVDPQPDPRGGHNIFYLSDQELSSDGLTPEIITISEFEVEVRYYNLPWDDSLEISLAHSGGDWVTIVNQGVVEELIEKEQVEIVAGSGRTTKQFYELVDFDYREAELGGLTVTESGEVTSEIPGNSLVDISYVTKYYYWRAVDNKIENVQFYPLVLE